MLTVSSLAHAIRFLSMDAVQQANSGHPGMPMGMADIATVLWTQFLSHNPADTHWPNRDRFVLSNGHGSMLLYALLHLTGYDLPLEDLRQFRQWGSKTPGHPEYHDTPGVETTTGPLGQGLANAVGMALAEAMLAARFNKKEFSLVDHYTYVFLGDGCLMEGISHEACSLAGTWKLGKLIAFWDNNHISIDGQTSGWFTDDTPARFRAYGWHVIANIDGHNPDAIAKAIREAQSVTDKPSLLCCTTVIGYGAPSLAGTANAHGAPLGDAEIKATREALGWTHPPFHIPTEYYSAWNACDKGARAQAAWEKQFADYQRAYPLDAEEFTRRVTHTLPENWSLDTFLEQLSLNAKKEATRKSSLHCIEALSLIFPELLGGSADLSGSNCTKIKAAVPVAAPDYAGNYVHYGVREFGMSAIMNGLALHGGFIPFGGTFLVFSDYARNAVRLSAIMRQKMIYVYSHDSIGLGEDGPTHQPIEHAASLRLIPGIHVWRPCDKAETAAAWAAALQTDGPSCLLLTRHDLLQHTRTAEQRHAMLRGGYILKDAPNPCAILIATGSEVELATQAADELAREGVFVRVVSMPCVERFKQQPHDYQTHVLPTTLTARVAIEAGSPHTWHAFVGLHGRVIGIERFGVSAPYEKIYDAFGLTVTAIKQTLCALIKGEKA